MKHEKYEIESDRKLLHFEFVSVGMFDNRRRCSGIYLSNFAMHCHQKNNLRINLKIMRKNLLLAFLLIQYIGGAQQTFQNTYGSPSIDGSWSVQQTSDRGYIVTAESGGSCYNLKTDSTGSIVWSKTYSKSYGNMVQETSDGGYITTGLGFYLIKSDALGNPIWTKQYTGGTEAYSLEQTSDKGYIIAGYTNNYGAGLADIYVVKTDSIGNMIWDKTYGGTNNEGIAGYGNISVQQTPDGGYIVAGYTNSFGAGGYDFYLIKTNGSGSVTWSRTFGGTGTEYGYGNSVGQTADGGYVIVGSTNSFGSGSDDVYLIKTNGLGNLIWSKTYGGTNSDYGYSVQQTVTGGYIISGSTNSFGSGGFDVYLIKTDAAGNLLWSKTFGGTGNDYGYSVDKSTDGGYVITGYTNSFGSGGDDVYLIKTDANGNSGCYQTIPATLVTTPPTIVSTPSTLVSTGGAVTINSITQSNSCIETPLCIITGIDDPHKSHTIYIYPNPSSGIFSMQSSEKITSIEIMNVLGEIIYSKSINSEKAKIDLSEKAKGIYFVTICEGSKTRIEKIIKD